MGINKYYLLRNVRGIKHQLRTASRQLYSLLSTNKRSPVYGNGNKVINHPRLENASITFKGKNNILYCESSDITLYDAHIEFSGDNSVIYISRHSNKKRKLHANIYIKHSSALYIGKNVNFHQNRRYQTCLMVSENKNVLIGDDCLISRNVWFLTSDGHAAYDSATKKRINNGRSIFIGDHVWLGQAVTILKGSRIGSGTIIGAGSIVTGKTLSSNTSCAGSPARELKQGVFFAKPDVNGYKSDKLKQVNSCETENWIYHKDKHNLSFDNIDKELLTAKTSAAKLTYIKEYLAGNHNKNRFYIGNNTQEATSTI